MSGYQSRIMVLSITKRVLLICVMKVQSNELLGSWSKEICQYLGCHQSCQRRRHLYYLIKRGMHGYDNYNVAQILYDGVGTLLLDFDLSNTYM